MCTTIETIGECLGKPVVDPYGRRLGFLVSFYSDVDGKVKSIEVNIGDLEYREVPVERIKVTPEGIVVIPEYEYEATIVENRLKNIKGRLASLEELYSKKEIATHVYDSLKKKLEEELAVVKAKSKEVKDALRNRLHEIEDQVAEVERSMGALKTSYLAGEISEKPYLTALDIMKKSLETLLREKDNVKKHIDKIESLEALPLAPAIGLQQAAGTQQAKTTPQSQSTQPMNVVVVE
jgi:DNA-binding FrmR family transcriptional regulator